MGLVVLAASALAQVPPGTRPVDAGRSNAPFQSHLPVVRLETSQTIVSEPRVPCMVSLRMPEGTNAGDTGPLQGQVRIHGASSQGFPKKSYAVTLEKPVQWLGLRQTAHWVLNAAYIDRSLMRHKLSYDLFQTLSEPGARRYASSSRFVEVLVNNRYQGAYLLMERVDAGLLGLSRFDSNAMAHAVIYKAIDHRADFAARDHSSYEQRFPDPQALDYWKPLDDFNRFTSGARGGTFFDPEKGIGSKLDLGNAIDFHILLLVTSNMDGYDKNFMIARDQPKTNAPPPRFFFVPWDYDATFGRNWNGAWVSTEEWVSNYLFDRLLEDAAYQRAFSARWKRLREKILSVASIHAMIDANVRTLGDAARRNERRWFRRGAQAGEPLLLEQDVQEMKAWVVTRMDWLDAEIQRRTK